MATIEEVARRAGVTRGTVSKVFSGTYAVSERTRAKVLEAAAELDYRPNLAARALSLGRTYVIGLLIPYDPDQLRADPHLLEIIHGVEAAANERDYTLLLSTARRPNDPSSAYSRVLRSGYVDGLVVIEGPRMEPLVAALRQQGTPWVVSGYGLPGSGAHCVHADDVRISGEMAAHLLGLGHRRIGIINSDPRPSSFDERLRGFLDPLRSAGVPPEHTPVAYGDMSVESGYRAVRQLVEAQPRPTAIWALNDRMALGAMQWVSEHGLRIPGDVSIAGYDDIDAAALSTPPLTTVRLPSYREGQEAVSLLFALFEGDTSQGEVLVPAEVIVRGSTGPASGI